MKIEKKKKETSREEKGRVSQSLKQQSTRRECSSGLLVTIALSTLIESGCPLATATKKTTSKGSIVRSLSQRILLLYIYNSAIQQLKIAEFFNSVTHIYL